MTETAAVVLSVICLVMTGCLGVIFALNAEKGLDAAQHRLEMLPLIMSDRYIGTALLLLGVVVWGDKWLLTWFLAVVAAAGYIDAAIYGRKGHRYGKHLFAGVLYTVAAGLAYAAHIGAGVS
ncbi:MAG: hypothetical protein AAF667_11485 [Pseudomonadota bacterium]